MKQILLPVLFVFSLHAAAQKTTDKPIDTTAYIIKQMKNATGSSSTFIKESGYRSDNKYTVTKMSLKDCTLHLTAKMYNTEQGNKNGSSYTLEYGIPLGCLNSIDTMKRAGYTEYSEGTIQFKSSWVKPVIQYKMIEDLTGRIETNSLYAETFLWCDKNDVATMIQMLRALSGKCTDPKNTAPCK